MVFTEFQLSITFHSSYVHFPNFSQFKNVYTHTDLLSAVENWNIYFLMRAQIFVLRGTRNIFGPCPGSAATLPPGTL